MKTGLLLLIGLYIFQLLRTYINDQKSVQTKQKEVEDFVAFKDKVINESREEMFQNLEAILGNKNIINLKEKEIWIDMPKCLIRYIEGPPVDTASWNDQNNEGEIFYYNPIKEVRSNATIKYHYEIWTRNNFVTGWKNH